MHDVESSCQCAESNRRIALCQFDPKGRPHHPQSSGVKPMLGTPHCNGAKELGAIYHLCMSSHASTSQSFYVTARRRICWSHAHASGDSGFNLLGNKGKGGGPATS